MLKVISCIAYDHALWIVALAATICAAGCAAFVAMATQSASSTALKCNRKRTLIDALVLAHAVWATHFVAMIGYRAPMAQAYDVATTAGSAFLVYVTTILAVALVRAYDNTRVRLAAGGLFGLGVAGMHYLGMAGFNLPVLMEWDTPTIVASVIIACAFGAPAFYLISAEADLRQKFIAGGLLVLSIAGLHFTGMSAITIYALPSAETIAGSDREILILSVAGATLVVFAAALTIYLKSGPRLIWRRNVISMGLLLIVGVSASLVNFSTRDQQGIYAAISEKVASLQTLRADLDMMAFKRKAALADGRLVRVPSTVFERLDQFEKDAESLRDLVRNSTVSETVRLGYLSNSIGSDDAMSLYEDTLHYHRLFTAFFTAGGANVDLSEFQSTQLNQRYYEFGELHHKDADMIARRYTIELVMMLISALAIFGYQGFAVALPGHRSVVRALDEVEQEKVRAEELALIARNTKDAIFISNDKGVFTWCNNAFGELMKMDKSELIGKRINELIEATHADKASLREVLHKLAKGQQVKTDTALVNGDGETIWASLSVTPIMTEDGQIEQVIHTARDVTEERELQDQVRQLALIAENATDSVFTAGTKGFIDWTNDSFLKLLGLERKDVIGKRLNAFLDPDLTDRDQFVRHLHDIGAGKAVNATHPMRNADGETIWVSLTANPVMDEKGDLYQTIHVARDVTEQKQMQDELRNHRDHLTQLVEERTRTVQNQALELETALAAERELNQMQTEFVSMASHEFRTPLTIIDGVARRLEKRADRMGPDDIRERAGNIRATIKRMTMLVERTLDASRLSSGRMKLTPDDYAARKLVEDVCTRQAEVAPTHTINCDLDAYPETLFGDGRLMDNVFTNLLSNAVKYSPENPIVDVRGWTEDGMAWLAVRDHGVGIPKDELPKIFERFFRASTSTGISGTGIGLNLVKNLVDMHYGEVTLDSVEGEWTEIAVALPLDSPLHTAIDDEADASDDDALDFAV